MKNRPTLTNLERERIYEAKMVGKTIPEIAEMVGCSAPCVRKWWRRGRDKGLTGLQLSRQSREKRGKLSHFDRRISQQALALKQGHPKWGPQRVLIELEDEPELNQLRLPAASTLAAYFKEACPECLRPKKPRRKGISKVSTASGVHEVWQLDHKEGVKLEDGEIATICNIRDPFAAAVIMSRAFVVTTTLHWRKLDLSEIQTVLRQGFTEWQTLPQVVQTDNELGLAGSPTIVFPSRLTLWLAGLGIKHQLIRPACPTDQAEVERTHRTMDGFAVHKLALANCKSLQASLDKERKIHNERYPSRASNCNGKPPLQAYPQLTHQPRPYHPDWEFNLFNLQYVADHLATYLLERKVNTSGQVSLGGTLYYIGTKYIGFSVLIHFDPVSHEWVLMDMDKTTELQRKKPKNFSVEAFTGLESPASRPSVAIQLSFPGFI
jgi:putative transposase